MRWGILATGTIAKKFADTVVRMAAEGEMLAAVGSRRKESAEAFAGTYQIPRAWGSYEELAADPEVEAVYIATPNSLHYENCKLCLEQGKHVLCEKPFTTNAEQARELYRLAEQKGLFLMEAFWTRLLPAYEKLRELLAAGAIGNVRFVRCDYGFIAKGARRERKFQSGLGGGALLDIGIYNLGFLHAVMGEAPEAFESQVHFNEFGTDDFSALQLSYPGGRVAHSVQAIGMDMARHAAVYGDAGVITFPDFQHAQQMTLTRYGEAPKEYSFPYDINGFEYQIREASACAAAGRCFSEKFPPEDSLTVLRLMDDIRRSWDMKFDYE
ncbi:MAG TPA: Gfo/Idh/MocA family oxidoreductase [Candidatus Ventrimonas merdavium]|nr:Gfo/Idh/MocA family oxidoreductase [Candidatus Ventrimonas merdavium]